MQAFHSSTPATRDIKTQHCRFNSSLVTYLPSFHILPQLRISSFGKKRIKMGKRNQKPSQSIFIVEKLLQTYHTHFGKGPRVSSKSKTVSIFHDNISSTFQKERARITYCVVRYISIRLFYTTYLIQLNI